MQELSNNIHPLARKFVQSLLDGRFDQAHQMLSDEFAKEYTSDLLQETFEAMSEFEEGARLTKIDDECVMMPHWPEKQSNDVSWNYVSVSGETDGFCMVEAVTVIIATVGGRECIREIEWGRP